MAKIHYGPSDVTARLRELTIRNLRLMNSVHTHLTKQDHDELEREQMMTGAWFDAATNEILPLCLGCMGPYRDGDPHEAADGVSCDGRLHQGEAETLKTG